MLISPFFAEITSISDTQDVSRLAMNSEIIGLAMIIAMKIVVFIIGYKIVKLGHDLLLAGVKGEFKFKMQLTGLKSDLASASPGLLFVLLGTLLCGYAIASKKTIADDINTRRERIEKKQQLPDPEPPKGGLERTNW